MSDDRRVADECEHSPWTTLWIVGLYAGLIFGGPFVVGMMGGLVVMGYRLVAGE